MKKLLALTMVALLAACSSEPRPEPIKLDYSQLGKIYLNTQDLRIINRTRSTPQWAPYVGHLFQPKLVDAIYKMANDRLVATGTMGHATLIIKDANITEQSLATASDFESMFKRQQASKYIGRVEISLEAQSPSDGSIGVADANAIHNVTLPEDATESEKYEAYRKLLTALMADLNRGLEQGIQSHMSRFVVSGDSAREQAPTDDSAMQPLMSDQ